MWKLSNSIRHSIHIGHHKTWWLHGSSCVLCGQVFTKTFLHVKFISNVPQRTHACTSSRRWLGQNDIRIQASERNFFIIWSVLHERWRCSFLPRKSWALQCPVQLYVIMFSAALHHRITTSHSRHIQKLLQPHLSSQRTFAKISQSTTILNGRNHCCGALERVACWERCRSDSAHLESLWIAEKSPNM